MIRALVLGTCLASVALAQVPVAPPVVTGGSGGGGTGSTPATVSFTAPATCSITGGTGTTGCTFASGTTLAATHNLGTSQPWVACYDTSGNELGSSGASTSVSSVVATSANVTTITFSASTSGTCSISTGSMGPVGATGATGPQGPAGTGNVSTTTSNTYSSGTTQDMSAATTLPVQKGTTAAMPGTCTQGQLYFATDATAGQNIYECGSANAWTQQSGGTGQTVVHMDLHNSTLASNTSTYVFAAMYPNSASTGSNGSTYSIVSPKTGTIKAATYNLLNSAGSTSPGGNTQIAICVAGNTGNCGNGTLVNLFTGNMPGSAEVQGYVSGLNQAVTAGQTLDIGLLPGTYTTNANVVVVVDLVIQ